MTNHDQPQQKLQAQAAAALSALEAAEASKEVRDKALHGAMFDLSTGRHGGFGAHLGDLWFVADSVNRAKIEATWPELIGKALALYLFERAEAQ